MRNMQRHKIKARYPTPKMWYMPRNRIPNIKTRHDDDTNTMQCMPRVR